MKTIVYYLIMAFLLVSCNSKKHVYKNNNEIIVHNLGTNELRLFNKYQNSSRLERDKLFLDSIYTPNQYLYDGYIGDEKDFTEWVNNGALKKLDEFNAKSTKIDSRNLELKLKETASGMSKFTGHNPKGKWYIFYGPSWTNLGGFNDGTMLIDLAHSENTTNEKVALVFAHELNHQIYNTTLKSSPKIVLNRIIDEGFASYISYIYHDKKYSIAQELMYSEQEYDFCKKNEKELLQLLKENYAKNDEMLSRNFADRGYKFSKNYPGAIGYYIGFRIVEEFVKINGRNSWKKLYTMQPEEVLLKSKILE